MLSPEEKERVRYHLGFLNVNPAAARALGMPSSNEPGYLVEYAMDQLLVEAEPGVRRCIVELDCIEDQLSANRKNLGLAQVAEIRFAGDEGSMAMERQYQIWADKLASTLGCIRNPFSPMWQQNMGGVIEPC